MRNVSRRLLAFCVTTFLLISLILPKIGDAATTQSPITPTASKAQLTSATMNAPLSFEANHGQTDRSVKFIARGGGYNLFLTPTESVMVLHQRAGEEAAKSDDAGRIEEQPSIKRSVVRMKLEGANPSPAIEGLEPLPEIVNYFIGNDPSKWRTKIPTYAKVHYKDAYPGIDVAYYGNQGRLEYDFIVAPGADPNHIKLTFVGASGMRVGESGDLILETTVGEVRLQKPVVYQLEPDGHKTLVAGNYIIPHQTSNHVKIQLAAYDRHKTTVIDPVLLYSTYLGGSANEAGIEFGPQGVAVNSSGEAYIAGATASLDFPGVTSGSFQPSNGGGAFDAYVAKLNSSGSSLLWSSYLGGTAYDRGAAIAVDPTGNAYVTGLTNSSSTTLSASTFPTTLGAFQRTGAPTKAFVAKISADGSTLMYSTLLGGASDRDIGWAIAVDASGSAYVAGEARNTFPVTAGAFQTAPADGNGNADVFVTKLNPTGSSLVFSTLVGGSGGELASGVAIDSSGNVYVSGWTNSTNLPGTPGSMIQSAFMGGTNDGFAFKLNNAGTALVWSTYLGGSADDLGRAIAVDSVGDAYATGQTNSANFLVTPGSFQSVLGNPPSQYDAFVTKISSAGSLIYSTYLGGNSFDGGWAIKADSLGNAHVTGRGRSTNFPGIVPLSGSPTPSPGSWAFYSKLNSTGSALDYSVYIGGTTARPGTSGDSEPLGIALDDQLNAYITGFTRSANFPLVSAAQSTPGGIIDDFVMKIGNRPIANAGPDKSVSEGTLVTLNGTASAGSSLTYQWTQMAGQPVSLGSAATAEPTFTAPHVPAAGGTVTFDLKVCEGSSSNCSEPDTVNVHIVNVNHPPVSEAGPDQTVQESSPVMLDGTASYDPDVESLTYHWTQILGPGVTLLGDNTPIPTFTAPNVGAAGATLVFDLTVIDARTLTGSDSVSVFVTNVNQTPTADAGPDQTRNENTAVTLDGSGSMDPDLDTLGYAWTQTGGPPVTLTGATTVSPTFTAPNVGVGGVSLTFQLVVNDGHVSSAADIVQIAIQNVNDPPVCTLAQASPNILWPPNHTMVPVSITGITDPNNQAITITFISVTQDEPVNGLGDGDTSPDAAASGNQILLRAERAGSRNGRVYVVHFTASDDQGGSCTGTVKVGVPQSKKDTAGEGAQIYNSFAP